LIYRGERQIWLTIKKGAILETVLKNGNEVDFADR
jgi:ATP-dependent phosphoenolpyruvate carboxykinase